MINLYAITERKTSSEFQTDLCKLVIIYSSILDIYKHGIYKHLTPLCSEKLIVEPQKSKVQLESRVGASLWHLVFIVL